MSGGQLLGVSVLELRTDSRALDAGLAKAEGASKASSGRMSSSMAAASRATADAGLKLKGYQLAVDSAQTRVNALGRALQSGKGDQQKLTEAMGLAQSRLSLAQAKMESYAAHAADGAMKTRHLSAETRSLSAETGISSRAFSDLTGHMGPVGRGLTDLTARTRLYREHGIDYLAAGMVGLEAGFVGLSVKAALHFEELGKTITQQTGLTGRSLEELLSTIRTVGRDSPYQLSQVTDAAVVLRQGFHETDAQISRTANLMVAFANATGQDVRPEMQQLQRIMTDYREPLSHVVGLTDKLVSVSQATQQPVGAMANTLDHFGPKLQALGFNLNDSVRLLALFSASGIKTEAMGRGLSAALSSITKTQAANQKLLADGPAKLQAYGLAVDSARLRVRTLSTELASGKGDQQKLNAEMVIAQGHLTEAKSKYDALNGSLAVARKAHGDITQTMHSEIDQIEHAKTKQDALNLAIGFFGKNLGPTMARALFNNKKAADEVDKALSKTGATQKLFGVDAASMPGKLQKAKNAFGDLEIEVGQKVLPALSAAVGWIDSTAHSIDRFYTHHKQLVQMAAAIVGIGSAFTLLSRHTPLGSILGRLLQTEGGGVLGAGRRGLAGVLSGGGSSSGMYGIRGPVAAGSLTNPVMVRVEGGTPGSVPGKPGSPGAPAAAEEGAMAGLRTVGLVGAGAAVAGMILEKLLHRGPTKLTLDQYLKNTGGGSGTNLPADLRGAGTGAAAAKALHLPADLGSAAARLQAGLDPKIASKFISQVGALAKGTRLSVTQLDHLREEAKKIAALPDITEKQRAGLKKLEAQLQGDKTAKTIRNMLTSINAIRFPSEPQFIKQLKTSFKSLPLVGKQQGADAMIEMSRSMEQAGRLPKGSTDKLIRDIEQKYPALRQFIVATGHGSMQDLATEFKAQKVINAVDDQVAAIQKDWGLLPKQAKSNGANVYANWKAAIDAVTQKMKTGSAASRQAATTEYHRLLAMQDQVTGVMVSHWANQLDSMKGKSASDFSGMADAGLTALQAIGLSTNQALKALGLTQVSFGVDKVAGAVSGGVKNIIGSLFHAAQGGLVQFGRRGEKGRDTIPVNFGGTPIMVGSGEVGAVLTGPQQQFLNARTADVGGLPGVFKKLDRKHYMAGGGFVPRRGFNIGGAVTAGANAGGQVVLDPGVNMSVGSEPSILADLHKLAAELGQAVYVISGYRSPAHSVSVGGFANDPHTQGAAADIGIGGSSRDSMFNVTEAQLRAVGLYRPFYPASANEVNHVQLLAGGPTGALVAGGGGGSLPAAVWKALTAPHIAGPPGPLTRILQAVSDKVTAGANKYGQKHMPAGGGISAGAFAGQGGGSAANEALGHKMMLAAGWPESEWPSLLNLWIGESGWSSTAMNNPSMGWLANGNASGIPQADGHGQVYASGDAAAQIAWGLNYIRSTYGSPSRAYQVWLSRSPHSYAGGGLIPGFAMTHMRRMMSSGGSIAPYNHEYPGYVTDAGGGVRFSPTLVAQIAEWAGLPGITFQQIAEGESSYYPGEIEPREASGAQGWGLWQITTGVGNDGIINQFGGPHAQLNPITSAKTAKYYYDHFGGMAPWHGTRYWDGSIRHYTGPMLSGSGGAGGAGGAGGKSPPMPTGPAKFQKRTSTHGPGTVTSPRGHAPGVHFNFPTSKPKAAGEPKDMATIDKTLGKVGSLYGSDTSDYNRLSELLSYNEGVWGLDALNYGNAPSDFVVTQDALGNQVAPYVDEASLTKALSELEQIGAWESQQLADLRSALALSNAVLPAIKAAIRKRQEKIRANLKEIARIKARIKANRTAIAQFKKLAAAKGTTKAQKAAYLSLIKAPAAEIVELTKSLDPLYAENMKLGGSKTATGSGGQIGTLQTELDNAQGLPLSIGGVTGVGGDMQSAILALAGTEQQIAQLMPGVDTALSIDKTQFAGSSASAGGADNSALISLLEQQLATAGQELAVSQAQYRAFEGALSGPAAVPGFGTLPPFGGSFAQGGTVPGPPGAARAIIAHGGEEFLGVGEHKRSDPIIHVHIDRKSDLDRLIDVRIEKQTRKATGAAVRGLPSRSGGAF